MELMVVLTNYLRPANMAIILDVLASQTLPHQVFVWDNSPEQSFAGQADWVVRSSRNAMCSARWWLAAHAETQWVLLMDDDLSPTDQRVLADLLEKLAEHAPSPVGAAGVILDPSRAYSECPRVGLECSRISVDTHVDILKGRFFAAPTQRLGSLGFLPLDAEDDIAASAQLEGGVVVPWLKDRLRELPTAGEARWRRPKHKQTREDARRQWFKK